MLFEKAAHLIPNAQLRLIEGPGHGLFLAKEAVEAKANRVIVAGGDGTLNTVAQGLIGTDIPLGLVAMGSGNGYARSIGLPLNHERALQFALTGSARQMDVCYLNEFPFLGTAGIGFDAKVAHEFDRSENRGPWNYVRIILREIRKAQPLELELDTGNEQFTGEAFFLCFANTTEFGNGMKISPASKPDDGMAELQLVQKPGLLKLPRAMIDIYRGHAQRNAHLRTFITDKATVVQSGTIAHVDGEPIEVGRQVTFRLQKSAIKVIA
jgi:YegS/Rv2252/BmrU family lipid kinase